MAAFVKERGNDKFITMTNNAELFTMLVSNGYVVEINNVLFVYDQLTKLWTVANADFAWLAIPKYVVNDHLWTLVKTKTKMSGKRKATTKRLDNTFQLAEDQFRDVAVEVANRDMEFQDVYEIFKEPLGLGEYTLDDAK